MLAKPSPAVEIIRLAEGAFERLPGGADDEARFEHEGHGVSDDIGLERSASLARRKVSASGPCPLMPLCSEAPPGTNPSAFAS